MAGVRRSAALMVALDAHAPLALARLHRDTPVGAVVAVRVDSVDETAPPAADLFAGAGFDLQRLDGSGDGVRMAVARRARTLPDFVAPGLRVLVCGLNPSLVSADAGFGYARGSNRFWPAAVDAGLVTKARDPWHAVEHDRVGMTDLVKRATVGAAELTADEYRAGTGRVERLVCWLRPETVVFVGLAGWRAAVDRHAVAGWQPGDFGGAPAYVMPSTSGLNAHSSRTSLTAHLRSVLGLI